MVIVVVAVLDLACGLPRRMVEVVGAGVDGDGGDRARSATTQLPTLN